METHTSPPTDFLNFKTDAGDLALYHVPTGGVWVSPCDGVAGVTFINYAQQTGGTSIFRAGRYFFNTAMIEEWAIAAGSEEVLMHARGFAEKITSLARDQLKQVTH